MRTTRGNPTYLRHPEALGALAPSLEGATAAMGVVFLGERFSAVQVAAFALATGSASAADLVTKAKPVVAPEPPALDFAFGSAIASDYIFRGVTQSNHKPSVAAYFEPRYNFSKDHQIYAGIGGASISFPNRAAGEVDFYAGYRPTFDKFAFDFGVWYYWYPGGQCFSAIANINTFDCT